MPTKLILRRSSALFFLTSATSVTVLIGGGLLLATGVSGRADPVGAWLPIATGVTAVVAAAFIPRLSRRRRARSRDRDQSWLGDLVSGVTDAERALRHPNWRLLGAIGYLGFDIAVLWTTLTAVGCSPPLSTLILGYSIGYVANLIPIPAGAGVLEAGIAGTLILYGAPAAQATAGALAYHAIAFWIPGLGGLLALAIRKPRHLQTEPATTPPVALTPSPTSAVRPQEPDDISTVESARTVGRETPQIPMQPRATHAPITVLRDPSTGSVVAREYSWPLAGGAERPGKAHALQSRTERG